MMHVPNNIENLLKDHFVAKWQPNSQINNGPFSAADLPIDELGRVYHLQMKPEDLASSRKILTVGDPGRASLVAKSLLSDMRFEHEHRGLYSATGKLKNTDLEISVVTTGMGTGSEEIVLNELVILNEIDFQSRMRRESFPQMTVIRVGTSGLLSKDVPVGTAIITLYSVGTDNSALFYAKQHLDQNSKQIEYVVNEKLSQNSKSSAYPGRVFAYAAPSDLDVVKALMQSAKDLDRDFRVGITVSSPGFFAAQGRNINRTQPTILDTDRLFDELDSGIGFNFLNMEMEQSFANYYLGQLGYKTGAICLGIANRSENTFDNNYQQGIENVCKVATRALSLL